MMKLIVLTALAAATDVPQMLAGTWDMAAQGHHMANVLVRGDRADFDDGMGDDLEYQIHVNAGLLEMNGWVARTDSSAADAVLWHKDNKEIVWRRPSSPAPPARKLRGGKALEQSRSAVARAQLPAGDEDVDAGAQGPFADFMPERTGARQHLLAEASTVRPDHSDRFLPKDDSAEQADNATAPSDERSLVKATDAKHVTHALKQGRKAPFFAHALTQAVMDKYITPLKVAQTVEKNETKSGKHERRKLFPAAMHSLAALMTNTQRGIDEDAFDDVIEMVRQIIRDEASATTTDMEGNLQAKVDAITGCSTTDGYSSGSGGISDAYDGSDDDWQVAVGDYDTAYSEEMTTCTEMTTTCGNRDAKGKELYTEVAGSSSCALPDAPDNSVTYDDAFVLSDVDSWAQTLLAKHTAWDTAKIECSTKEQECSAKQTTTANMETAKTEKCTGLAGMASSGLSAYNTCFDQASGEYDGYDATALLDTVKNSIEAVETLMCYIDVAMEGLAKTNKDDRSSAQNADAATSCSMDDQTSQYVCMCSDGNGERYQEPYSLGYTAPTKPARDDGWDALGCPDAGPQEAEP